MRTFILFGALLLTPAAAQDPAPGPAVAVTLSDGSVLVAAGGTDAIELRTAYGDQKIPLKDIRMARRLPEGTMTVIARGVNALGDVRQKEIELTTSLGTMRVSTDEIRSISRAVGARDLVDEGTVALWWFSELEGDVCKDLVKGRPFQLHDYESASDAAGQRFVARKKSLAFAHAATDDDLEMDATKDYTLEIRFKSPEVVPQYMTLLYKGDPNSGWDYNLTVQPNHFFTLTNAAGHSMQSTAPVFKPRSWNTITVVQRTQPPLTACYVNGRLVQQLQVGFPFSVQGHRSLYIGPCARNAQCDGPEAIQFVRISKVARTAQEIADLDRSWESGGFGSQGVRGVGLRDGGFLKAELPALAGATFRTRYGALPLTDRMSGMIDVYRMRPKELERSQAAARELISRLGAPKGEDRDAAEAKLIAMGEAALPVLRSTGECGDSEVKSRVEEILKKLEAAGAAKRPAGDVLRLGDVVLHGWLELDAVTAVTSRRTFRLATEQVQRIFLGKMDSRGRQLLQLKSGEILEFNPASGAKGDLETPFGRLSVPLDELRTLSMEESKERWTLTTDRLSATGKLTGAAEFETILGPLTIPLPEVRGFRVTPRAFTGLPAAENE